jgi:hypothetical protein
MMNSLRIEDNNDSETTLNDYETPGNSFLNISGANILNTSNNGHSTQFTVQSNKKPSGLVQGVIQSNTTPTLRNSKPTDLENLTFHSNDSTPTLRNQSLNENNNKHANINNDTNKELSDVMRARQLVMRFVFNHVFILYTFYFSKIQTLQIKFNYKQ